MRIEIFPRVVPARKKTKITLAVSEGPKIKNGIPVSIKIQPMEHYSIPHTDEFRIDEEDRYPYIEAERLDNGNFVCEYEFGAEQKYSVRLRIGERTVGESSLYALEEDFMSFRPFKGDTHLHTAKSDGEGEPFEVGIAYRKEGFDFIAITDHHKMEPSVEANIIFSRLTKHFFAFVGEEVHNKQMGYFHLVNLGGKASINKLIEESPDYVQESISRIMDETNMPVGVDKRSAAHRIFIAREIKRTGGVAIMAHPFWDAYGEYNMPLSENIFLMKSGEFDGVELFASNDERGAGDNLEAALWSQLRASGVNIATLGASDAHYALSGKDLFAKRFSIVLAKEASDIFDAIKQKRAVAVSYKNDSDFFCFGEFRLVKYARFLIEEYYPCYKKLAEQHARALVRAYKKGDRGELCAIEIKIDEFVGRFFSVVNSEN